ncbi:MAG TPA: exodeoxyribonuclease III [Planctomycetes bacterium]|nr:exodeoxyribonuclease III [Planctomycetota bacterium]
MRIATWNVNSVRARLPRLLPWLEETGTEVVCLQETKCVDELFPREAIEDLGYQIATHGQKTYNGVAILSKRGLEDVRLGFGREEFDGEARAISAVVDDVMVMNVYVVNGREVGHERYDYKLRWLRALRDTLREGFPMDEKVVVCGDFNVTFDDKDIYDPEKWHEKILCSTPEREVLGELMELGLEDSLRRFHPDGGVFTWWDFRTRGFERGDRGLRIDHLLMSPPAMEACTGVEVDREARAGEKPSDHAPVVATLED